MVQGWIEPTGPAFGRAYRVIMWIDRLDRPATWRITTGIWATGGGIGRQGMG
jgi:hypothetical protein